MPSTRYLASLLSFRPKPFKLHSFPLLLVVTAVFLSACSELTGPFTPETPEPKEDSPSVTSSPVAVAVDHHVALGKTLRLEGSSNATDGEAPNSHSWELLGAPDGSTVELTPEGAAANFSADTAGLHIIRAFSNEPDRGGSELITVLAVSSELAKSVNVTVTGVPQGTANLVVTNHGTLVRWMRESGRLVTLPTGDYEVVAAPVTIEDRLYLPAQAVQSFSLSAEETLDVKVDYQLADSRMYATVPNFYSCEPGTLTESAKERALGQLNFIRALSGVPSVQYHEPWGELVQQASLSRALNDSPDVHRPPQDSLCYSNSGYEGASRSNLYKYWATSREWLEGITPEQDMNGWSADSGVISLGHRRWNLDPTTTKVAYGMTTGPRVNGPYAGDYPYVRGAALYVMDGAERSLSSIPLSFVAYPIGDFPAELLAESFKYLSFSALPEKGRPRDVDFSSASVQVIDENGSPVPVDDVSFNNSGYGVRNHLQWRVAEADLNKSYLVQIENVWVNGTRLDYAYTFVLRGD